MSANRLRLMPSPEPLSRLEGDMVVVQSGNPVDLEAMPPPMPIPKIPSEQIIEDILVATLQKVRRSASPEMSEAALKYIRLIRGGELSM